jgi:hypothetical protein
MTTYTLPLQKKQVAALKNLADAAREEYEHAVLDGTTRCVELETRLQLLQSDAEALARQHDSKVLAIQADADAMVQEVNQRLIDYQTASEAAAKAKEELLDDLRSHSKAQIAELEGHIRILQAESLSQQQDFKEELAFKLKGLRESMELLLADQGVEVRELRQNIATQAEALHRLKEELEAEQKTSMGLRGELEAVRNALGAEALASEKSREAAECLRVEVAEKDRALARVRKDFEESKEITDKLRAILQEDQDALCRYQASSSNELYTLRSDLEKAKVEQEAYAAALAASNSAAALSAADVVKLRRAVLKAEKDARSAVEKAQRDARSAVEKAERSRASTEKASAREKAVLEARIAELEVASTVSEVDVSRRIHEATQVIAEMAGERAAQAASKAAAELEAVRVASELKFAQLEVAHSSEVGRLLAEVQQLRDELRLKDRPWWQKGQPVQ